MPEVIVSFEMVGPMQLPLIFHVNHAAAVSYHTRYRGCHGRIKERMVPETDRDSVVMF
jgi:hypothetical protein